MKGRQFRPRRKSCEAAGLHLRHFHRRRILHRLPIRPRTVA